MTKLKIFGLAVAVCAMGLPMAAMASLSGNYLLTATNVKPSQYRGSQLCVTLNEDGSVLGWQYSGEMTIDGLTGQFFENRHELTGWIYGSNGVAVLNAYIPGSNVISNTSFDVTDSNGNDYVAGSYTVQKGAC